MWRKEYCYLSRGNERGEEVGIGTTARQRWRKRSDTVRKSEREKPPHFYSTVKTANGLHHSEAVK